MFESRQTREFAEEEEVGKMLQLQVIAAAESMLEAEVVVESSAEEGHNA